MGTQRNYLINTTTISTTASGTTIGSGNTQSATFVVAQTLVRSGIGAAEFSSGVQTWAVHYVVSAMTTPYEMRLKVQRRNSGGTMQAETGYGTVRTATGTYDDNLSADLGTWAANDQLALVWEHRRPSGTGNKNGTIDANGASYIDAPTSTTPLTQTCSDNTLNNYADAVTIVAGIPQAFSDNANNFADSVQIALGLPLTASDNLNLWADDVGGDLIGRWQDAVNTNVGSDSALTLSVSDNLNNWQDAVSIARGPFPTTGLLDRFNRADENPAAGWTQLFSTDGNIRVASNQAAGQSGGVGEGVFAMLPNMGDQEVYVDISTGSTSGPFSFNQAFLFLRVTGQTSDSATGYLVHVVSNSVTVYRVDSFSSLTELTFLNLSGVLTVGDQLGARARGSVIEVWVNIAGGGWVPIISVTDATYATGRIGLGVRSDDNTFKVDNFGGGVPGQVAIIAADDLNLWADGVGGDIIGHWKDSVTTNVSSAGGLTITASDDMNLLTDGSATVGIIGYDVIVTEDMNLWADSARMVLGLTLNVSDNANNWADSVVTSLGGGSALTLNLSDNANNLADNIALRANELLACSDSFALSDAYAQIANGLLSVSDATAGFSDAVATKIAIGLVLSDDANNLADSFSARAAGFLTLNDNAGNLADSYAQIGGGRIALSDTAPTFSDAVVVNGGIAITPSDSLPTFADGVALRAGGLLAVADSFTLSDAIANQAVGLLVVSDALPGMTDAIATSAGQPALTLTVSDTLPGMADSVATALATPLLTLAVSDSLPVFDDAVAVSLAGAIPMPTPATRTGNVPREGRGAIVPPDPRRGQAT